jgi:hypothetical protein
MILKSLKELNNKCLTEHYLNSEDNKILNLVHLFYYLEIKPELKRKVKLNELTTLVRVKLPTIEFIN